MRDLAQHAHSLTTRRNFTILIGQKNAPEIAASLVNIADFAVLEDCKGRREDDPAEEVAFCVEFQRYITARKPVLSIEYPPSLESGEGSGNCNATGANLEDYEASCDDTRDNQNFSTVLKIKEGEGELNGCTQYCDGGMVGTGVVVTVTDPDRDLAQCPPESTSA